MTPTMTLAHFVFAFATTAYIVLAIQFEERDLVAEHGAAYAKYRHTVPMLLPGVGGSRVTASTSERAARLGCSVRRRVGPRSFTPSLSQIRT